MTNLIDLRPTGTPNASVETTLRQAQQTMERPANVIVEPLEPIALSIEELSLWYGPKQALTNVSLKIPVKK